MVYITNFRKKELVLLRSRKINSDEIETFDRLLYATFFKKHNLKNIVQFKDLCTNGFFIEYNTDLINQIRDKKFHTKPTCSLLHMDYIEITNLDQLIYKNRITKNQKENFFYSNTHLRAENPAQFKTKFLQEFNLKINEVQFATLPNSGISELNDFDINELTKEIDEILLGIKTKLSQMNSIKDIDTFFNFIDEFYMPLKKSINEFCMLYALHNISNKNRLMEMLGYKMCFYCSISDPSKFLPIEEVL